MSLHLSEVAIEGSHLSAIPALFQRTGYRIVSPPQKVGPDRVGNTLFAPTRNESIVRKAVYELKGWTHICDPEMVVMWEDDELKDLSKTLDARIVGWICEGGSGTYGLKLIQGGEIVREALSVDGNVTETGNPLPDEDGIDWAVATEDEVLKIAERLGPSFEQLSSPMDYLVYELDESDIPV